MKFGRDLSTQTLILKRNWSAGWRVFILVVSRQAPSTKLLRELRRRPKKNHIETQHKCYLCHLVRIIWMTGISISKKTWTISFINPMSIIVKSTLQNVAEKERTKISMDVETTSEENARPSSQGHFLIQWQLILIQERSTWRSPSPGSILSLQL